MEDERSDSFYLGADTGSFLLCIFDDCAVVGQEKPTY